MSRIKFRLCYENDNENVMKSTSKQMSHMNENVKKEIIFEFKTIWIIANEQKYKLKISKMKRRDDQWEKKWRKTGSPDEKTKNKKKKRFVVLRNEMTAN